MLLSLYLFGEREDDRAKKKVTGEVNYDLVDHSNQGFSQSFIAWRCTPLRFLCALLAPSFNTHPGPSQLTGHTS